MGQSLPIKNCPHVSIKIGSSKEVRFQAQEKKQRQPSLAGRKCDHHQSAMQPVVFDTGLPKPKAKPHMCRVPHVVGTLGSQIYW